MDGLTRLDEALFFWINDAASGSVATTLSIVITFFGNGLVLALVILPALYLRRRELFRAHALPMVLAVATSGLAVNLAKIAFDRPRPPERFAQLDRSVHAPLGSPPDRSFPSGHAQTAFGAATYLACLFPAAAPALITGAALVGLSRVTLGVHFPSDVLVGAAAGALTSLGVFVAVRRRRRAPPGAQRTCQG